MYIGEEKLQSIRVPFQAVFSCSKSLSGKPFPLVGDLGSGLLASFGVRGDGFMSFKVSSLSNSSSASSEEKAYLVEALKYKSNSRQMQKQRVGGGKNVDNTSWSLSIEFYRQFNGCHRQVKNLNISM